MVSGLNGGLELADGVRLKGYAKFLKKLDKEAKQRKKSLKRLKAEVKNRAKK